MSAPPLIFLHGFLGSPDVWDPVVAELNYSGPITAPALPGHGPKGVARASAPEQFLQNLPDRAVLVGYSLGARLALSSIASCPDRISSAVLIGVNPGLRSEAEQRERAASDAAQAQKLRSQGLESFVKEWESQPLFASQSTLPDRVREQHHMRRTNHSAEGIAWALETFSLGRMPPLWEVLKTNKTPIHLITGALDEKFTAIAKEMVATIPHTTHTIVAGAGHDVVLERPAAVAAEIRAALKEHA